MTEDPPSKLGCGHFNTRLVKVRTATIVQTSRESCTCTTNQTCATCISIPTRRRRLLGIRKRAAGRATRNPIPLRGSRGATASCTRKPCALATSARPDASVFSTARRSRRDGGSTLRRSTCASPWRPFRATRRRLRPPLRTCARPESNSGCSTRGVTDVAAAAARVVSCARISINPVGRM